MANAVGYAVIIKVCLAGTRCALRNIPPMKFINGVPPDLLLFFGKNGLTSLHSLRHSFKNCVKALYGVIGIIRLVLPALEIICKEEFCSG